MSLLIKAVEVEDFDRLADLDSLVDDDLCPPQLTKQWPLSTAENNAYRNRWAAEQQRNIFLNDSTAYFVKVINAEKPDGLPLALARWHRYPSGFLVNEHLGFETHGLNDTEARARGLKADLLSAKLQKRMRARLEWTVAGPCWFMTTLKTRSPARRRGAGGMLIDWGVERAMADGAPAYIEASLSAVPLYEKHGFKVIGRDEQDLSAFGATRSEFARMAANI